ncbi:MAG TPA: nucleotidyl transferase AbiEii/AbiGii toxin family protein [Acidimicrobiales bacterium]|nr:nucleotidyl transferase AbiEii/AbiGii toxin family protein [Acidimicrobiales bacterium]
MIASTQLTHWSTVVPWISGDQVEQDLVLSRLIVEIAQDPYLGDELVFRGGTCLHKLYDAGLTRYSEDLDYVRRSGGGIGDLTRAVTAIGERLGMDVRTKIGRHPKIFLRAPFESGAGTMRVKVEVNTFERARARPLTHVHHAVSSPWFTGDADVQTFDLAELVATKIRALFQRSKGRDLFDLWLAITRLGVTPHDLVACFGPYRPDGYTARRAELNLREKLEDEGFRSDLVPLVGEWPAGYDINRAGVLILDHVLPLI